MLTREHQQYQGSGNESSEFISPSSNLSTRSSNRKRLIYAAWEKTRKSVLLLESQTCWVTVTLCESEPSVLCFFLSPQEPLVASGWGWGWGWMDSGITCSSATNLQPEELPRVPGKPL